MARKEQLPETALQLRILRNKYPEYKIFEREYIEGGYYDRSEYRYYGDGKLLEKETTYGTYQ